MNVWKWIILAVLSIPILWLLVVVVIVFVEKDKLANRPRPPVDPPAFD